MKISWSLEVAGLDAIMIVSLWNSTGISPALLPICLSNFRAITRGKILTRISIEASRLNDILCLPRISWRLHQMETFSALLAICAWNSPVPVSSCNLVLVIRTGVHRTRVAVVTLDNMTERVFAQREDLPKFCGVNHRFSRYIWLHRVDLKPFYCCRSLEQRKKSLYIEI